MAAAILALLTAVIEETPAFLDELEKLVAERRKVYPSVRAAVEDATADEHSALLSKP